MIGIRRPNHLTEADVAGLADVLMACVEGGASVSFMLPLTRERALSFWTSVARAAEAGDRILLVAEDNVSIVGTVRIILNLPENQPHRVDVAKLLVHPRGRRRGIAAALMRAADDATREAGRSLMVLDAVTGGDAARLYERVGWIRAGDIPVFALDPAGGRCSATFYYRQLDWPSERKCPRRDGDAHRHH
jgi:GNAT superfamily N-acetyltransferase